MVLFFALLKRLLANPGALKPWLVAHANPVGPAAAFNAFTALGCPTLAALISELASLPPDKRPDLVRVLAGLAVFYAEHP